jgi:hypothetical protein
VLCAPVGRDSTGPSPRVIARGVDGSVFRSVTR